MSEPTPVRQEDIDAYTAKLQAHLATATLPIDLILSLSKALTRVALKAKHAAPVIFLAPGITVRYDQAFWQE